MIVKYIYQMRKLNREVKSSAGDQSREAAAVEYEQGSL